MEISLIKNLKLLSVPFLLLTAETLLGASENKNHRLEVLSDRQRLNSHARKLK